MMKKAFGRIYLLACLALNGCYISPNGERIFRHQPTGGISTGVQIIENCKLYPRDGSSFPFIEYRVDSAGVWYGNQNQQLSEYAQVPMLHVRCNNTPSGQTIQHFCSPDQGIGVLAFITYFRKDRVQTELGIEKTATLETEIAFPNRMSNTFMRLYFFLPPNFDGTVKVGIKCSGGSGRKQPNTWYPIT